MNEKFPIPSAPADKPGGGPGKQEKQPQKKKERRPRMRILDRVLAPLTEAGAKELRHQKRKDAWLKRQEKQRAAHTESPEAQIPRLHALTNALVSIKSDDARIRKLIHVLAGHLQKQGIPKLGTMSDAQKNALAEEARQYIFLGILQPYSFESDGTERQKPLVNNDGVMRHLQTYIEWREAEEAWRTQRPPRKWKIWKKTEREEKTTSMPKFDHAFSAWQLEQRSRKPGSAITRPPTIPDTNLVVSLSRRLNKDHMHWDIGSDQPK